jgi:hypothetical protein
LIISITMSYMGFECTQCNFKSYANCVIYVPILSSFKLHMYIMSRFCKVLSIALFSNKPRLENLWAFVNNILFKCYNVTKKERSHYASQRPCHQFTNCNAPHLFQLKY